MSQIKISEAKSVQFPMVKHASAVGWERLTPEEAEGMRRGRANMLFPQVLEDKLREFNPWLNEDQARAIVETHRSAAATIEGNREVLRWIRGERQWHDENETAATPSPGRRLRPIPASERSARHVGVEDRAAGPGKGQPRRRHVRASTEFRSPSSSTRTRRTATRLPRPSSSCGATRWRRQSSWLSRSSTT